MAQTNLAGAVTGFPPEFQSAGQSNGTLRLQWGTILGQTYQVQFKTSLSQTTWSNLGPTSVANGSTLITTDSVNGDTQRFYRLILAP
jgi:hypothetical protein